MTRPLLYSAFAGALLLECCGSDASAVRTETSAVVATAKIDKGPIEETLDTYGRVEFAADRQRNVSFVKPGLVLSVRVVEGQTVKKSDELLRVGAVPVGSPDVQQATIAADFAARELVRVRRLVDEQLATNQDLQNAEKQVAAASASLRAFGGGAGGTAGTAINASMDGIVAKVLVHRGDVVQVGQSAILLAARDSLSIRAGFEVEDLPKLEENLAVRIESAYRGDKDLVAHATLSTLHRFVDAKTQLVEGVIRVSDPPTWMAPGLAVRVVVVLAVHAAALRLPRSALVHQSGDNGVFVIASGHAHWHVLSLGLSDSEHVEILSGAQDGDEVATTGRTSLTDAMAVRLAPQETAKP